MAIGTLTAIGLGLAGAGAFASSHSQSNAANTAANTAVQTSEANNALTRDIYNQNATRTQPFAQRGNVAGDYLNALLGIPTTTAQTSGIMPTGGFQGFPMGGYGMGDGYSGINNALWSQVGQGGGFQPPQPQGVTNQNAQDAFRQYIQNSDYGFQFGEGANRINSGYAGAGVIKSGAAMKALEGFRQNLQAGYRGEFMNALGNQQNVGLSGTNALSGVSTNMVNTISGNNNAAGNALANAALARGNSGIGNALSMVGGGLFGYGTGR